MLITTNQTLEHTLIETLIMQFTLIEHTKCTKLKAERILCGSFGTCL